MDFIWIICLIIYFMFLSPGEQPQKRNVNGCCDSLERTSFTLDCDFSKKIV